MKAEEKKDPVLSIRTRSLPVFFTRRFFVLFGVASVLLLPAYAYHSEQLLIPLFFDAVVLLAALVDYATGPSPKSVQIERLLRYPLAVGRANQVLVEITNTSNRALSMLFQDDVPEGCRIPATPVAVNIAPEKTERAAYQVTPWKRGKVEFGNIHYWVAGALGLVWKHGESEAFQEAKLYPGLALIQSHRLKGKPLSAHDMVRPIWRTGEGTEFDSLRDYSVGDDSRLVHWSTSARRGKLVVRQNRVERGQTVLLMLDAGRMMTARVLGKTKLEHALQAALLLAYAALEAGDKVGVMGVARDVVCFLPPAGGMAQFRRILEATYDMQPRLEEPRFHVALPTLFQRLRRRALVVVFSDVIDERASQGLTRACFGLLPRHLPLIAAMSDTECVEVADAEPEGWHDLYRQGVAAELLERRGRLLARMGSSGVMVVDMPPEKISAAVLDRYLSIKSRNLL